MYNYHVGIRRIRTYIQLARSQKLTWLLLLFQAPLLLWSILHWREAEKYNAEVEYLRQMRFGRANQFYWALLIPHLTMTVHSDFRELALMRNQLDMSVWGEARN